MPSACCRRGGERAREFGAVPRAEAPGRAMLINHLPEAAQPTLRCPGCKHANPAHSNFCNICGRGLPSVPCPQCGEMNDLAMATMCSRCGGPLTDRADSEAAKDARLRVIEAAMGGGFPPMAVARAADTPASPSSVDVNAVAALSPLAVAAASEPAPQTRSAAPPAPVGIPTLTASIPTPAVSWPPSSNPSTLPSPLASSPMATAAPVASTTSASAWASKPAAATAPLPSRGPPASSLARMPRSSEPPVLATTNAASLASGSGPAQPGPTLADFGPSAFNLPHLNVGHSANNAPFVLTGWRTDEPQGADFDMRQINELVRTSLAAETVPMLPALSSGAATAHGEPEQPPGRIVPRPRRLAMAGGVAAALVVAVLAYRVYGPARVPELTPVPLAGGGGAVTMATVTATAAVDRKAAQMQANLDRAAELLAQKPTGAGVSGGAGGEPVGAAPAPIAVILPTTLAPVPAPTSARQGAPHPARPAPSRETAVTVAAARTAKSPPTSDSSTRPYTPPNAYKAQLAPAAGPCTEGVVALGLCDAVTSPATPRR